MLFSMLKRVISTGHQTGNVQKRNLYGALDSSLEKFECQSADEIHFTNPEFVGGIPPFACQFAKQPPISHLLAAADEDGQVFIYDTNVNGQTGKVKDWSAHNNAIFDIAWSPTDPRLVTASGDQSAALWDAKTANRLTTFKQHRCSLKSVSFRPWDGHVFASGARDGSIMIWDDRCNRKGKGPGQMPVICVNDAHIDQKSLKAQPKRRRKLSTNLPTINSSFSVSAVLFQKDDVLLSAGSADGIVKVWDVRKMKTSGTATPTPSHQFLYNGTSNRKRGFSSLALTSTRTQLFVSCTDSIIYEYDLSGALGSQPVRRYQGHMNSTFFVKAAISPDDLYLLSGSSDNSAYVWRIGGDSSPSMTLEGHDAEVTSVTWCPTDFTKVVTCSDDNTMRIWKMPSGRVTDDNGVSRVIGTAKRYLKEVLTSESLDVDSAPSQASQSGSDSCMSTPTSKTGESPLSPQLSPMPSSTKKRRFSLKEWVTTSPKTSRPASPLPTPKRLKSESSEGVQGSLTDGEAESVLKRKMVGDSEEGDGSKRMRCDVYGASSTASVTCPAVLSKGSKSNSSVKSDSDSKSKETESVLKRANTGENTDDTIVKKKAKVNHTELASEPLESRKCFNSHSSATCTLDKDLKKDTTSQTASPSPHRSQSPSSNDPNMCNHDSENDLDKENCGKNDKARSDRPEISHNSGQRSPLKDDLPMNRPKCSSASTTKRNIASNFQASSKTNEGRDENEEVVSPEMQQQNLKECFKEKKKNGGYVQTNKKRGITRRIDGYFQPIQRKRPSES